MPSFPKLIRYVLRHFALQGAKTVGKHALLVLFREGSVAEHAADKFPLQGNVAKGGVQLQANAVLDLDKVEATVEQ